MSDLVRLRYNIMAAATPRGEWSRRVILERDGGFEDVLAGS
jgi:hypothetical protein